jgi:hypothetical protein
VSACAWTANIVDGQWGETILSAGPDPRSINVLTTNSTGSASADRRFNLVVNC